MSRKEDYRKYLQSPDWKEKKERKKSGKAVRCAICGDTKGIQVHHVNYKNWVDVEKSDLRLLCDRCHGITHELIRAGTLIFKSESHHHRFETTRQAVKVEIFARGGRLYWPGWNLENESTPEQARKKARTAIQSVPCPYCLASVGQCCIGARSKPRESNHKERVDAYSERKGKG